MDSQTQQDDRAVILKLVATASELTGAWLDARQQLDYLRAAKLFGWDVAKDVLYDLIDEIKEHQPMFSVAYFRSRMDRRLRSGRSTGVDT